MLDPKESQTEAQLITLILGKKKLPSSYLIQDNVFL
ncbi:unnamed protein product [Larinioides sclopetarius]|uniref:Uncharacterized protein n=1 Tax=Larinioides sclopetarius TaxID=280406 RepID=A0AAV1Z8V6_9ARAC